MKPSSDDRPLEPDDFARLAKLLCLFVLAGWVMTGIDLVPGLAWWEYLTAGLAALGTVELANRLLISPDRVRRKRVEKAWRGDCMFEFGMLGYLATTITLLLASVAITGGPPVHVPFALVALTGGWTCQGLRALWCRDRLLRGKQVTG